MQFSIQNISVEVRNEEGNFFASPAHGAEPEAGHYDAVVRFTTNDGWVGDFAAVSFPHAGMLMGRFIWTGGAISAPYDRLNTAGNTSIKEVGGHWIIPVKAMRKGGKDYPTLNRVSEEELDSLVGGSIRAVLQPLGEFELERLGDLDSTAGKQIANGLGFRIPVGNHELLGAMIATTRPLALVKGL